MSWFLNTSVMKNQPYNWVSVQSANSYVIIIHICYIEKQSDFLWYYISPVNDQFLVWQPLFNIVPSLCLEHPAEKSQSVWRGNCYTSSGARVKSWSASSSTRWHIRRNRKQWQDSRRTKLKGVVTNSRPGGNKKNTKLFWKPYSCSAPSCWWNVQHELNIQQEPLFE